MQLNYKPQVFITYAKQKGAGMIEVLIALLLFSGGVLGIANLQLSGLNILSNSNSLSFAVLGASGMADRMRANPLGVEAGNYNAITGQESDPSCGSICTPAQIAQSDAYAIKQQLDSSLANAQLSVTSVTGGMYTVQVSWTEKVKADSETKTYRFTFLPYNP